MFGKDEQGLGNRLDQIVQMKMKKLPGLPVCIGLISPSVPGDEIDSMPDQLNQAVEFIFQLPGPTMTETAADLGGEVLFPLQRHPGVIDQFTVGVGQTAEGEGDAGLEIGGVQGFDDVGVVLREIQVVIPGKMTDEQDILDLNDPAQQGDLSEKQVVMRKDLVFLIICLRKTP